MKSSHPIASEPLETSSASPLASIVMTVVSEKTGYPTEMLALEMSLDHDLGIDSIKRVEILSALQERVPNLPAFQPDELGSLHTLSDVVALADARMVGMPDSTSAGRAMAGVLAARSAEPAASVAPAITHIQSPNWSTDYGSSLLGPIVLAVVSEKTGYPIEMLNLEMSLDHDLGIDSIKRVEILSALQERVPNLPAFQPEELGALHTLQDVVTLADARSAGIQLASAMPVETTRPPTAPDPTEQQSCSGTKSFGTDRPRSGVGEDRLSRRDAQSGYEPGSRSRHRLDQTGRDLIGTARTGPQPARIPAGRTGCVAHAERRRDAGRRANDWFDGSLNGSSQRESTARLRRRSLKSRCCRHHRYPRSGD